MPALDDVIRSLLNRRKGHAVRLSHGLALRYTPPTKEWNSPASILSLSRPSVPPSPTEVQVVINSLARVLNAPGSNFLVTGDGLVRRIWFVNTLLAPPCQPHALTVYQAITWVDGDWISLGIDTDPDEVIAMGKRAAARLRYPGGVRIVQYQIQKQEN